MKPRFDYKEIVLSAVKQNGKVLVYASANLQKTLNINFLNDKEIVLHAVKQDGRCLQYAAINLRNDKEIVEAAIKQNKKFSTFCKCFIEKLF